MGNKDYLPAKDADLLAWAQNASTLITAAPTSYGLTVGIASTFSGVVTGFDGALSVALAPSTRTRGSIATKNEKKKLLKANARAWAKIVQATSTVTPQQKLDLGL